MRNIFLIFLLLLLMLFVSTCKPIIKALNHKKEVQGVYHGDKLSEGAEDNCTVCHGIHLDGNGWIPGCRTCHGVLWNLDEHTLTFNGVPHQTGFNASEKCGECHGGSSLQGAGDTFARPSCYSCHDDLWTDLAIHTINVEGAFHVPGLRLPFENCATCHGDSLRGKNNSPSCFECHDDKWNDGVWFYPPVSEN